MVYELPDESNILNDNPKHFIPNQIPSKYGVPQVSILDSDITQSLRHLYTISQTHTKEIPNCKIQPIRRRYRFTCPHRHFNGLT